MKVGLVVHPRRALALEAGTRIADLCRQRGLTTVALHDVDVGADHRSDAGSAEGLDLVVSLGGDGTLLRAALIAGRSGSPVLGVNIGRLGFLTEVEPAEIEEVLDSFLAGELEVEERLTIQADAVGADWRSPQWALNEVMVEKRARHRVITLATYVGDEYVTTISGDGVIVATPTGSTAYSFSARGPIVHPGVEGLVITPVSPHMVFDRPLVIGPDAEVRMVVEGEEPGLLAPDGRRSLELPVGSEVRIRRSPFPARLLRRPRTESFFARLRRKFSLPTGPRGG